MSPGNICFTVKHETAVMSVNRQLQLSKILSNEFSFSHQIWAGSIILKTYERTGQRGKEADACVFPIETSIRGASRAENLTYRKAREIKRKETERQRPWEWKGYSCSPSSSISLHRPDEAPKPSSFPALPLWPCTPTPFLFCSAIYSAF